MRVLVLGSGLLGVTTAYALASRGHEVEVVERKNESGAETSFANGGQLSYAHAEPWATPHVLAKLPRWLLKPDSPLIFRPRADLAMVRWGLAFLRSCTKKRAERATVNILRLGLYSREKMLDIIHETGMDFHYAATGILHIYSNGHDLAGALRQFAFQAKFGCDYRALEPDELIAMEPALAHSRQPIVGGIHTAQDASGDAYHFCRALTRHCTEKFNTRFRFGATVQEVVAEQDRITAVRTDQGEMRADAYVMALGSYSPLLTRPLGIHLPIYPMKGYSVTVPAGEAAPRISITDGSHKIVFSRLKDRLRVAGTAEFAGYNPDLREERITPIVNASRRLFPQVDWDGILTRWACLRPSTPDGPPILGRTPYANLYLNTGHGTLGWTHAAGSATIVADLIENRPPEIMLDGLTLERFMILYDWGGLNAWLFGAVNGIHAGWYDQLMLWLTAVSDHHMMKIYVPAIGALLFARLGWRRLRGAQVQRQEVKLAAAQLITLVMGYTLYGLIVRMMKSIFALPRPFMIETVRAHMRFIGTGYPDASEYYASFPSGHAATAAFLVTCLWPYLTRPWRIIACVFVFAVCWSRLAIGMHFPADVAGGALIGMLVAVLVQRYVFRMMRLPQVATRVNA